MDFCLLTCCLRERKLWRRCDAFLQSKRIWSSHWVEFQELSTREQSAKMTKESKCRSVSLCKASFSFCSYWALAYSVCTILQLSAADLLFVWILCSSCMESWNGIIRMASSAYWTRVVLLLSMMDGEQYRPQDWSLRNACHNISRFRKLTVHSCLKISSFEITTQPDKKSNREMVL